MTGFQNDMDTHINKNKSFGRRKCTTKAEGGGKGETPRYYMYFIIDKR